MKKVYLTRVYRFNAGHRLHDPSREEEWNRTVFGKCSLPGGHGHNYTLEVTVAGAPDPETGFVCDLSILDSAVQKEVLEKLDHRNLNDILSKDFGPAPTTEVLILELWRSLEPHLGAPARLHALRVSETAKNFFELLAPPAAPGTAR